MPIYEYKCRSCERTFEMMQKVSDPPLNSCIHCSGPVAKVISPAGLVFKGSGWYITDYSSKGKEGKETKPSSGGESKTAAVTANQGSETKKTSPN